jgi:hypothetical protein
VLGSRASVGPCKRPILCSYMNEFRKANGPIEKNTIISKSACAPLFFLQTCDHIEISPKDPSLGVDVVGYLVQVPEEGFLVS